jgi:hypothetical protein
MSSPGSACELDKASETTHDERATHDAHAGRIQRKWVILLRRANARESALRSALTHARAAEVHLRVQLEHEQRRHTIESGLLRERLQRLEQSFLSYIAAGRGALRSPMAVLRGFSGQLGMGSSVPTLGALPPGSDAPVPTREARAPIPFDPVATVESLLPLSRSHAGAPEADIAGALGRLQAIVHGTDAHRADAGTAPALVGSPASGADAEQLEHPPVGEETLPVGEEEHTPADERSISSDTPWFPRAFRRLADEDPEAAGRLFLQLLPAQGLVWPEDLRYRMEIAETGSLAVAVRAGSCTVQPLLESGPAASAGVPTLRTDLAGLARTVAGRRGWSRVGARIASSRNRHMRPLRALAAAPLELRDLKRAGVQADPVLLLRLLALAIDPEWTSEEIFTIACRWRGRVESGCYIHVFESTPVAVTSAPPLGRVAATLSCEPKDILDVLLGNLPLGDPRAQVSGERTALASLLDWFRRVDATATTMPAEPAGVAG